MKKTLLLRHGSAASRTGNMTDFDRPLDKTGKTQISNISNQLREKRQLPDHIISSAAVRALSSAKIIQNKESIITISETKILYSADIFEYIDILGSQNNSFKSIMLVAHNPTISGFISKITGKHIGMGTGNLCILEI
ncbi:MAG: histidine phosphatase family protein, partial [Spirochaetaceae bacterium]|nr:histidine phosphatase family protein [Spirochaetaceae bacterium]